MLVRTLALLGAMALSIGLRSAHAADPNDHGQYPPITEQTKEELRAWAALHWEWRDTGEIPPALKNFQFSQDFPSGFHPFNDAWALFTAIYADQLDLEVWDEAGGFNPNGYSVVDLINDDPDVRAHFRLYTTTGWLSTSLLEEPGAAEQHLLAVIDAISGGHRYELSGEFIIVNELVLSKGLEKKVPGIVEPGPEPVVPEVIPLEIKEFLHDLE